LPCFFNEKKRSLKAAAAGIFLGMVAAGFSLRFLIGRITFP
jgi:hypothetical protein